MLPIALDIKQMAIALIGEGEKFACCKEQLEYWGATPIAKEGWLAWIKH